MNCNHKDGWILKDNIVINPDLDNDNLESEAVCNHLGCMKSKKFKLDIINVREI